MRSRVLHHRDLRVEVTTRNKAGSIHDKMPIKNSNLGICATGNFAQRARVRPAIIDGKQPSRISLSPKILSEAQLEFSEAGLSCVSETPEEFVCRNCN